MDNQKEEKNPKVSVDDGDPGFIIAIIYFFIMSILIKNKIFVIGTSVIVSYFFGVILSKKEISVATFFETLKSTKPYIYILIGFSSVLNLVFPSYHLENKYGLISTYVIIVSFLEGVTGYYEQRSKSKSES